jgi:hypothetical protein
MESGKIYKIVSNKTDKIYIGSTIKTIKERLDSHEESYINWINSDFKLGYISSFEILKYGDYKIFLIEEYPCSSYSELFKREGHYQIQNYNLCVNIKIASRRPYFFKTIKLDSNYTCSCGKKIKNNYKFRYYHTKSEQHKLKIQQIHLDMIQNNPKFELSMVEEQENEPEFDLKNGKTIDIFY